MTEALSQTSELLHLLQSVSRAVEQDALRDALRNADRAWRQYPENIEIARIYARLLLRAGEPQQALRVAERAAPRGDDPDLEAVLLDALLASGEAEGSVERLRRALGRYALSPDSELATAARRIVQSQLAGSPGFIGITGDLHLYGELLGGTGQLKVTVAVGRWCAVPSIGPPTDGNFAPFGLAPPVPGNVAAVSALVADKALVGSGIPFPPDFRVDGRATATETAITGWARLGWSPKSTVTVRLAVGEVTRVVAATPDPTDPRRHLFALPREACGADGNRIEIAVAVPGGGWQNLPDTPLVIEPGPPPPARRRGRAPAPLGTPLSEQIDIVVPVYRGCQETLACLGSLIATVNSQAEIIVVDDATPEPELAAALDALARSGRITLLRHRRNLGFPAAANRGLARHPDRDVVIVNADAQVFDGWLARLRAAAYGAPDIGTVTPLTNAGSLASYPVDGKAQPSDAQAAELARLTARANAAAGIELPTGVGFCLYVRRDCLREVGSFDAATFDKGYGEENDFCLRAAAAGWRHLLAPDVFVLHRGARSFGARREALTERGLRLLDRRYPHYRPAVEAFLAQDPAHAVRRRLDEELLVGRTGRCVLLITHALPGGVERHVNDRAEELKKTGLEVLRLRPLGDGSNTCVLVADDPAFQDLRYRASDELAMLRRLLARLLIEHIEIHHTLDLDPAVIETTIGLDLPYDVIIHDYALVCPRIMFSQANGRYCGMPGLPACEACIKSHGSLLRETVGVGELRGRSARWLQAARRIVAPSQDAAARIARYVPGLRLTVQPWERLPARLPQCEPRRSGPLRAVVIGAIGERKGYDLLLDCVRDAHARELPLEFTVIGHTMDDALLLAAGNAFVTGRYDEAEIAALIRREDADLALYPYVTPETWCYTLTHGLQAGLPIVAFDIGAVAERLRQSSARYRLVPLSTGAASLNDQLIQFHADLVAISQANIDISQQDAAPVLPEGLEFAAPSDNVMLGVNKDLRRSITVQTQRDPVVLSASVEALSLEQGLYLFSVRHAAPVRLGEQGMMLPALHVGTAPGVPAGHVTMMTSPGASGAWLYRPNDVFVVRVTAETATILVTSIRTEKMGALGIDVRRLDAPNGIPAGSTAVPRPSALLPPAGALAIGPIAEAAAAPDATLRHVARVQIVTHVQNRGDLLFTGPGWAGCLGQRLPVEAFSIHPLEFVSPSQIEYKAYTATGIETAWVSDGALCGTRGIGVPLVGFAIRLKNAADLAHYECTYSGAFTSGRRAGPFTAGTPCRAASPDDRLEAIRLSVIAREPGDTAVDGDENAAPAALPPKPKPTSRREIRPRFSALREPPE